MFTKRWGALGFRESRWCRTSSVLNELNEQVMSAAWGEAYRPIALLAARPSHIAIEKDILTNLYKEIQMMFNTAEAMYIGFKEQRPTGLALAMAAQSSKNDAYELLENYATKGMRMYVRGQITGPMLADTCRWVMEQRADIAKMDFNPA